MLYLIDANVLIRAHYDYYPLDRIPQFWDWLEEQAKRSQIKMPFEIYSEIGERDDLISRWISEKHIKQALILDEKVDEQIHNHVINTAYAPDLTDEELEKAGNDPFLVAYALKDEAQRCVVTKEVSKLTQTRGNRKIPDACKILGIRCVTDFTMYQELDFKIP